MIQKNETNNFFNKNKKEASQDEIAEEFGIFRPLVERDFYREQKKQASQSQLEKTKKVKKDVKQHRPK